MGDGVIDVIIDLELLMSYWGQPFDDPTLLAHWALDEAEGIIAYDSAGMSDAYLMGEPVWLPDSGSGGPDVGGLVGYNEGSLIQCYSTSMVIGKMPVGRLVGMNVV